MESVAFIQWCLDHLNYWTITLLMTIESSFIPFPSEVVIPPAAYKAAVNDELNIYLVVVFATIGANIGALINYFLAKWLGRPIIYKFANSRFGHMCLIDEAKVRNAETYFDKHGALSTFIGRLIPAVRQLISILEQAYDPTAVIHIDIVSSWSLGQAGHGHDRTGEHYNKTGTGRHIDLSYIQFKTGRSSQ